MACSVEVHARYAVFPVCEIRAALFVKRHARHDGSHVCGSIDMMARSIADDDGRAARGLPASISFDKVAAIYDETRGGLERGVRFAAAIARHCGDGPTFEIGIGTGAIAIALRDLIGRPVLGADLSPAMLIHAQARLGATVVEADVECLPVAAHAVATVIASWILHLVGDPAATVRECRRVLRPNGRLVVISSRGELEPDDIESTQVDLHDAIRGRLDVRQRLEPIAAAAGFDLVEEFLTDPGTWLESPADLVERMVKRQWGVLIELDDERFARIVQPVIDGLSALPEPERKRTRVGRHRLFVFAPR